jgi:hypothetical protein
MLLLRRGQQVVRIGRLEHPITCISLDSSLLLFSTYSTCLVLQINQQVQTQVEACLLLFSTYSTCLVLQVNQQVQTQVLAISSSSSPTPPVLCSRSTTRYRLRWRPAFSFHLLHLSCAPGQPPGTDTGGGQPAPLLHLLHLSCAPGQPTDTDTGGGHSAPLLHQLQLSCAPGQPPDTDSVGGQPSPLSTYSTCLAL